MGLMGVRRMGRAGRTGLVGLAIVVGLSTLLGGCAKGNKEADLAKQEAAELRERNATLEQSIRDRDARLADLESRANAVPADGFTDADVGSAPRGGRSSFTRNAEGRMAAEIAGDVLFSSGSDAIKPDARKQLDRIASEVKSRYAGADVRVEGYTDSDPIRKSKWGTNERLSQARADAVRKYLVGKGIGSSRVESVGYGSSKPRATKAQSRRVDIVILGQ